MVNNMTDVMGRYGMIWDAATYIYIYISHSVRIGRARSGAQAQQAHEQRNLTISTAAEMSAAVFGSSEVRKW